MLLTYLFNHSTRFKSISLFELKFLHVNFFYYIILYNTSHTICGALCDITCIDDGNVLLIMHMVTDFISHLFINKKKTCCNWFVCFYKLEQNNSMSLLYHISKISFSSDQTYLYLILKERTNDKRSWKGLGSMWSTFPDKQ